MESKDCCLAVMKDLQAAGRACLELHFGGIGNLAISIFGKPESDADSADFIRIKHIGTVVCRGPFAQKLKQWARGQNDELICFGNILNLMGITAHHEGIYLHALKSGSVILVLQGRGGSIRQGCKILEEIALGKPVLYLA